MDDCRTEIWYTLNMADNLPHLAIAGAARICAALLFLAGCGQAEPAIRIGFAGPFTGDQAAQGLDMLEGARLAVEEAVSRGGVLPGFRIELVPMDDQRNPAQAVSVAKRLAADPNVMVVVGHLNSSCTKPASAIYYEARLLHVNPVSSNPEISRQGFDTFFRVCATDDLQGPAGVRFALEELKAKRLFILDDMTTYGRGLANEFEKAARAQGLEILGHEGIAQGEKDFSPLLTKVKSLGPDLIYFAGMFPEGALLIKQKSELEIPAHFLGGDGLFEPTLITLATPRAAEGIYLTTLGADIRQVPSAQSFVRAFEAKHGHLGAYSSYAYEATRLALEAVRRAGRKDRAAVLAAMREIQEYDGILGVHTFDEKGDTTLRTIGIYTVRKGKFQFVQAAE
ncbi:MAG: branched-chain amino acid ABC transporter substrate-binding protein [Candidatus Omnitrophica bacterium]|nr:branched-chain amino acid ABC transporter substrate-binding protein [Candidatus Omnitrophota bacterium]